MRKSSLERHLDCNKINKPLTNPPKSKPKKPTKPQKNNKQNLKIQTNKSCLKIMNS